MSTENQANVEMVENDNEAPEIEESDIFNIMITTDNHLGYKENDRTRSNDSFYSFEEALKIA